MMLNAKQGFDPPLLCNKMSLYMFGFILYESLSSLKLELCLLSRYLGIGIQRRYPKLEFYEERKLQKKLESASQKMNT